MYANVLCLDVKFQQASVGFLLICTVSQICNVIHCLFYCSCLHRRLLPPQFHGIYMFEFRFEFCLFGFTAPCLCFFVLSGDISGFTRTFAFLVLFFGPAGKVMGGRWGRVTLGGLVSYVCISKYGLQMCVLTNKQSLN